MIGKSQSSRGNVIFRQNRIYFTYKNQNGRVRNSFFLKIAFSDKLVDVVKQML